MRLMSNGEVPEKSCFVRAPLTWRTCVCDCAGVRGIAVDVECEPVHATRPLVETAAAMASTRTDLIRDGPSRKRRRCKTAESPLARTRRRTGKPAGERTVGTALTPCCNVDGR